MNKVSRAQGESESLDRIPLSSLAKQHKIVHPVSLLFGVWLRMSVAAVRAVDAGGTPFIGYKGALFLSRNKIAHVSYVLFMSHSCLFYPDSFQTP
jgi:hypothetical protein